MSRPRPSNISTALPEGDEYVSLTPRTPHSRTARAEGGFAKLQVSDANDFDDQVAISQQQSAPLLASSTSARFTAGLRPQSGKGAPSRSSCEPISPLSRVLLVFGVFLAGVLLLLIVLSLTRPEVLHRYVGATIHGKDPSTTATSIPPPLQPTQYLEQCQKHMSGYMSHGDYWDTPSKMHGAADVEYHDSPDAGVCKSTITYMLDGKVGLAADLALMAQAAALARERNRTFFVDDTYWNRGKWSDYFEDVGKAHTGPQPGCKPPPSTELVACPRTARHWIINSRTAKYHFGHEFNNHYEDSYAHELNRFIPMFEFARESMRSTIRPNSQTTTLINLAKGELRDLILSGNNHIIVDEPTTMDTAYISVHIRRGDRKPHGYEYHGNYIPTKAYLDAVSETWDRLHDHDNDKTHAKDRVVFVASDSPAAIKDFIAQYDGPTFTLSESKHAQLKQLASPNDYSQKTFDALSEDSRILATRGAIVDLALMSGLWGSADDGSLDATICSVSSNFCRLAAIGMGWERAFGYVNKMGEVDNTRKRWVDIDLKGHEVPVWQPFELF